jgi:TolA-binding protein
MTTLGTPLDKVEAAYQKALGLHPESAEADRALLRMGQVNHRAKFDDKAKGYFNLLLKEHPQSKEAAEAKLELARILLDEGQPQPAVVLLRELTTDKSESPLLRHALWYLGRALLDLGRFIEADQRLSSLIQRWPDYYLEEPALLYYLGETAFRLDKMDEARRYLYWYLNLVPDAPGLDLILTRLGETYRAQKDYKKAAAVYAESVRRFGDSDGGLIARIRLAEIKDLDQGAVVQADKVLGIEATGGAEQTYRSIISSHPDRPVADLARLKLGAVKYYQKSYQEAFDTFRELLRRHPESEFSRDAVFALRQSFDQLMKNLADRKEAARLITLYESFAKELPPDWQRRYFPLLAQAYFDLKLYGKALEYFQEAVKASARDPQMLLGLALSLYNESRFGEAIQAMSRFLGTYPAHRMANHLRLLRGQALLGDNQLQPAAESFQEVLSKAPDAPEYWPAVEFLAQTRIKQGQTKAAVELLTKTLAQAIPDQTRRRRLELTLGEALLDLGDSTRAAEILAKALQDAPLEGELGGLHYRLGQAYLKVGELDKAREVLTKVAKSGDKFWSKLAQDRLVVAELGAKLTNRGEVVSQ